MNKKDQENERSSRASRGGSIPGLVQARKLVVAVIGFTVLALGICLLVLPGPAFLVIPTGLAILATEFVWARRWLRKAKQTFVDVKNSYGEGGDRRDREQTETSGKLSDRRS